MNELQVGTVLLGARRSSIDIMIDARSEWDWKERVWRVGAKTDQNKVREFVNPPKADAMEKFRTAADRLGFDLSKDFVADGRWHSVRVEGDKGKETAGSYKLTEERRRIDGREVVMLHGYLKNNRIDKGHGFSSEVDRANFRPISAAELQHRHKAEEQRLADKRERDGVEVRQFLDACPSARVHPYLDKKRLNDVALQMGLKVTPNGKDLIIPLTDDKGVILSYQKIVPFRDGSFEKRFATGVRQDGLWHLIGEIGRPDEPIKITEGWATAASVAKSTGESVLASMSAGSLEKTVRRLIAAGKQPNQITVCAEDDEVTPARVADRLNRAGVPERLGLEQVQATDVDLMTGTVQLRSKVPGKDVEGLTMSIERDGAGHVIAARSDTLDAGEKPIVIDVRNRGREAANKCAELGTQVVYPEFTVPERAAGNKDFNDLMVLRGTIAVRGVFAPSRALDKDSPASERKLSKPVRRELGR